MAHRPWPLPERGWSMGQTWEELLFAHWQVPIEALRAHLPPELEVDTYDGAAYLGITPFRVTNVRLRGLLPVPLVSSFTELNCRTYVTHGGDRPGIWFFSLDASSRLAVEAARRLYKLPYFQARMSPRQGFASSRVGAERPHVWESRHAPTGVGIPEGATLERFLAERYCLYTTDERGALHRADIHHPPWPLQGATAEIRANTIPPDGLAVAGEPHLMYSALQDVLIWSLERVV